MNDKKNNMGLQQGSAGCKIRVHRIFRVGPHGVGRWWRQIRRSFAFRIYIWSFIHIFPISLTFGRQCGYHTNTGRLQVPTRATRQTFRVARFFSPMAPSWDGERAGPLPNMLFGAKHGGRHHQWCVSTLPSSRRQILRCSWTRIEDFDRDTRTDGLIYTAANLTHSRPSFLGFLRQSKTSL
jgi:hypothetical protein